MTMREAFEKWYATEYEWYMSRKRRGYDLRRAFEDPDMYMWEHPQAQYTAFCAAWKLLKGEG